MSIRTINKINAYISNPHEDGVYAIQKRLLSFPIFILIASAIYCILGPMASMIQKDFVDSVEWLLCEFLGIPFIILFSVPFFLKMIFPLDDWSKDIPQTDKKRGLAFRGRLFVVSFCTVFGSIILTTTIAFSIVYKNQDASVNLMTVLLQKLLPTVFVVLIISFINIIMFGNPISRNLRAIEQEAKNIANGVFNTEAAHLSKPRDEIGILISAFSKMIEALKYKANLLEMVAAGDLTINVLLASDKDRLGTSLNKMKDSLNRLIGLVNQSVELVSSGSNQVSDTSQKLSQSASQQASSLEEIGSTITEINSQAKQNAESAKNANTIAKDSKVSVEKGNQQMKDLVHAMNDINESSDNIKKIIKTIDDIAFQTNLLALNANVEAARAGKYGKGFAVVAEEARKLAGRSADSVKETIEIIEGSLKNVERGNTLVESTAQQLNEINNGISKVVNIVEEISFASNRQSQGFEQITHGIGQIEQATHSNTASAEESASAAKELADQASQLKAMVANFKINVS